MELAESLVERADAQKRLAQVKQRVMLSARFQEGEDPPEDPQELLAEADRIASQLEYLIKRINRTNSTTQFEGASLTEALARRDVSCRSSAISAPRRLRRRRSDRIDTAAPRSSS